jgi:uncharacterized protein (DUF58 family)
MEKRKNHKKLIIKLQRLVKSELSGIYRSVYKGEGIEYDRIREYQPWDDFKFIEWNSSSRYGRLFVKEYMEERNIPIIIAVDVSNSMFTKLRGKPKIEISAELTAIISSIGLENNDLISLILFSDKIEYYSPLENNKNMIMKNYYKLANLISEKREPLQKGTNYKKLLFFLENNIKKRALIFIISDFLPFEIDDRIFNLNKKNEVFFLLISDPIEVNPPRKGVFKLKSPETNLKVKVDFKNNKVYYQYKNLYSVKFKRFTKSIKSKGINLIEISTMSDPYMELLKFFKAKARKR